MRKNRKFWLALLCSALIIRANSQTLFTYGNKSVSRDEFLKAFNKNNTGGRATDEAYRNYLNLYIRFKLKVNEALARHMDTLPNQKAELRSFRNQIAGGYMTDEASLNHLVQEAAERSQRDIHVAHILVKVPAAATEADWNAARKKIEEAYAELKRGKNFETVAMEYSDDPSVKINHGDLGYITALVLPYDLETAVYNTAVGKFSKPIQSAIGYHILCNMGSRPAAGRMRAAQILLAFPPKAGPQIKEELSRRADSLYRALRQGADFKALAREFSDDNITYQNGGEMPSFGIGRYDPAFEKAAFGLKHDGDISTPVETVYGYHIIKRLGRDPIPASDDSGFLATLKQDIMKNDRMEVARKALQQKIEKRTAYHQFPIDQKWFWNYTDSVLTGRKPPAFPGGVSLQSALFRYGSRVTTLKDWNTRLLNIRSYPNMLKGNTAPALFEEFREKQGMDYYRDHLENFNKEFAYQLNEFREGNLLFEIMQRKVWDAAAADSAGLKKYFENHKDKYWWNASAEAIILTCSNDSIARRTKNMLRGDIRSWRRLVDQGDGTVQGDSGRFELTQIPAPAGTKFVAGKFTADLVNKGDKSSSFSYIVKLHPDREPRDFNDARGYVINDYQNQLEDKWIAELRKKYPVKVKDAVLKSLPRD